MRIPVGPKLGLMSGMNWLDSQKNSCNRIPEQNKNSVFWML